MVFSLPWSTFSTMVAHSATLRNPMLIAALSPFSSTVQRFRTVRCSSGCASSMIRLCSVALKCEICYRWRQRDYRGLLTSGLHDSHELFQATLLLYFEGVGLQPHNYSCSREQFIWLGRQLLSHLCHFFPITSAGGEPKILRQNVHSSSCLAILPSWALQEPLGEHGESLYLLCLGRS